jgi:hypothetical protein
MINPRSYENYSRALMDAAEKATTAMLEVQTRIANMLIIEPNDIMKASGILEREIASIIREYNRDVQVWIREDLPGAYLQGIRHTDTEIRSITPQAIPERIPPDRQPLSPAGPSTPGAYRVEGFSNLPGHKNLVNVFQAVASEELTKTVFPIIRDIRDKFRELTIEATREFFRSSDTFTRRGLSQTILNRFADDGIRGIRYRNGMNVPLESYTEMVGRTLSGRAAMQASLNRYQEYGQDLVRVSSHAMACPICEVWEGEILSQSGNDPNYASLDEAINDGLFHPNCAHDISPYYPGQSEPIEPFAHPAEMELYKKHGVHQGKEIAFKASQKQRYYERGVRRWKNRSTVALDEATRKSAQLKVREWQKHLREHLNENPYLIRKRWREQIGQAI